jgi:integrase/recombinase XerD
MTINMPKISYFLRSNNDNAKTHVVYCRVTFNGSKAEFSLKEKVLKKDWSQATQRLKKNTAQKQYLDHLQTWIEYNLKTLSLSKKTMLANELISMLQQPKEPLLSDVLKKYIAKQKTSMRSGTLRNYDVKYSNFLAFEKHQKTKFTINTFTLIRAKEFISWFQQKAQTANKDTANRHILFFRAALIQESFLDCPLIGFRGEKDTHKTPTFLTMQDLECIRNMSFNSSMLERIRDLFLFQCFTGLSYCDLFAAWEIKDIEAGKMIVGKRGKNGNLYSVPLMPGAIEVIEKYNGKLPKYTNEVYNRILKEIAALAGIQIRITTHTARRTFATLMDIDGWTRESLARMMGHTSVKTTELYYIGENSKRIELEFLERKKTA